MKHRRIFRIVLTVYLLTGFFLPVHLGIYLDNGGLDKAWEALPDSGLINHTTDLSIDNEIVEIIVVEFLALIFIAPIIGLFLFKNWARWLFFGLTLIPYSLVFLSGPTIFWGWEAALNDISNILLGVILASMFLPPISTEFNKAIPADRYRSS